MLAVRSVPRASQTSWRCPIFLLVRGRHQRRERVFFRQEDSPCQVAEQVRASRPIHDGFFIPKAPSSPPWPARLLRLPEVIAHVGLKRSAIYQCMSEGKFPGSRSFGPKCAVAVEAEIDDWIHGIALQWALTELTHAGSPLPAK